MPAEFRDEFFIQTRTVNVVDLSPATFKNQTAVVLANVADLPAETTVAIRDYVARGGGLLIFPGSNTNASNLNSAFAELLPATIGEAIDGPLTLQASGYDHSITALWADPGSGSLADATFLRAFTLTTTENSRTVLRFNNGDPAITERDFGLGKVFLFASTADTEWNNLAVRPAFLPLTHRLLGNQISLREDGLNIATGCGPGAMKGPMKGAAIGHAKQQIESCHVKNGLNKPPEKTYLSTTGFSPERV